MSNENKQVESAGPATLSQKVDELRDQARDILRMEAINKRLAKILSYEIAITRSEKELKIVDKPLLRAEYRLGQLDEANPDYTDLKKDFDQEIEYIKKDIEQYTKEYEADIKEYTNSIKEQKEGIEKLESGDTKMNKEEITTVAHKLISKQK